MELERLAVALDRERRGISSLVLPEDVF